MWFGRKTIFEDVFHLLPNHGVDVCSGNEFRYWVDNEPQMTVEQAALEASKLLSGTIKSANNRYKLMLGVTAGLDSRLLLAASKDESSDIFYFIDKMNLSNEHNDISIPKKLLAKLNLKFNILTNDEFLRDEIYEAISDNVTMYRNNTVKHMAYQKHYDMLSDYVRVDGLVNELVRNFYGTRNPSDNNITVQYLLDKLGYQENSNFLVEELTEWLNEVKSDKNKKKFDIMELFYWEQRMGNWGCISRKEQDFANEGLSPFNNRKLIMILSSVDNKYRQNPNNKLYFKMLDILWKETISEPINPEKLTASIKRSFKSMIPLKLKVAFRKMKNL